MKTLLIIILASMLGACSTIDLQNPAHRIAIQYATSKFIEQGESQKRAEAVIAEVEQAKTLIDMQAVPLSDIKARIIQRVSDRGLSPADTLLATALIDVVNLKIAEDIDNGVIGANDKIRINSALELIKQAATVYLP